MDVESCARFELVSVVAYRTGECAEGHSVFFKWVHFWTSPRVQGPYAGVCSALLPLAFSKIRLRTECRRKLLGYQTTFYV